MIGFTKVFAHVARTLLLLHNAYQIIVLPPSTTGLMHINYNDSSKDLLHYCISGSTIVKQ